MRTLIIDDEPKAIELLKGYLTSFEHVQLLQTFRNGISALEYLNSHEVDLIFLELEILYLPQPMLNLQPRVTTSKLLIIW